MNSIIPGTISQGTLHPYELIPKFLAVLKQHNPEFWSTLTRPGTLEYVDLDKPKEDPWWHSDEASDVVLNLVEALDELSPPGFFFGAHSGDPSDYGFWPVSMLL